MSFWGSLEQQRFFQTLEELWPGKVPVGTAVWKAWGDVSKRFHPDVALKAIRELFENQERSMLPTLAAFRSAALQVHSDLEAAMYRRNLRAPAVDLTISPQEIAEDGQFWEPVFDRAQSPRELELLKGIRQIMTRGAGGAHIASLLAATMVPPEFKGEARR